MDRISTYITGWSSYHPEGRLTNDELVERLDTTHAWLDGKLGIRERRRAAPGETLTDMCAASAAPALERAGRVASDLDFVIGTSSSDDMQVPSLGARVADRLGAPAAHAFDVKAACSGFFAGLEIADSFLQLGRAERVLISAGELTGMGVDQNDRNTVVFFGDGTAAGVVDTRRPERGLEVVDFRRLTNNDLHHVAEQPTNGYFRTDTRAARRWVEEAAHRVGSDLLAAHGLGTGDLRALVCHQANLRLIEAIAASLDIEEDRHWHNVEWAGNLASAGGPSALFEGIDAHADTLVDGDLLLVATVGAGLNAMAVLLRWTAPAG